MRNEKTLCCGADTNRSFQTSGGGQWKQAGTPSRSPAGFNAELWVPPVPLRCSPHEERALTWEVSPAGL